MARYFFDIETDGLLDKLTKVHSLVIQDVDTGEMVSCHDHGNDVSIEAGLLTLLQSTEIIGHNIIKFDIPALQKVYPWFQPQGKVTDTLVCSRLIWPAIKEYDLTQLKRGFPGKLVGWHSLKAWGYRLGILKGDFGETTDWAEWSPEMQSYCEQDVVVTAAFWERIQAKNYSQEALDLEHEFATILAMQERHGFAFDEEAAHKLYGVLVKRRLELARELQVAFPPVTKTEVFIPKVNNKARGYVKGVPFTKEWTVEFNPSSRQMIGERLIEMGWVPEEFTPSGQPKIDETILEKLPYPEAKLLAEHFLVEKRIGQLAEGDQAWLKLVRNGRIHGSVNTNGAVTGRCTHSNPNVAQVPSCGAAYGEECRALFGVPRGYSLVGADLAGLELRCLAHFMARYDGGAYGDVVLNGDIHTVNQEAAGLPTRNNAKTFIYAFLYGAGDEKIGSIVVPQASPEEMKKEGARLKRSFLKKTPALRKLRDAVKEACGKGYLKGLDGRHLHIRSDHAALNTLLQSAGALIAKKATIFAYRELCRRGYKWGKDFALVAHVHDEMQFEVRKGLEEEVGKIVVEAMREAGRYFKFACPIDGEFKIGRNWKETH
jgi:DNA polymerase-1